MPSARPPGDVSAVATWLGLTSCTGSSMPCASGPTRRPRRVSQARGVEPAQPGRTPRRAQAGGLGRLRAGWSLLLVLPNEPARCVTSQHVALTQRARPADIEAFLLGADARRGGVLGSVRPRLLRPSGDDVAVLVEFRAERRLAFASRIDNCCLHRWSSRPCWASIGRVPCARRHRRHRRRRRQG